ncbi:MAG: hypothetical protein ABUT20_06090 [Bacteroidota bacterium]
MKFILVALAIPTLIINECGKNKGSGESGQANIVIPVCVQLRIDSIKREPVWNPPAQVDEYIYNGKQVFLFSSNCCDQYNILYDSLCNRICAASGGITGKGDGKCADFSSSAKHIRLVWKDTR